MSKNDVRPDTLHIRSEAELNKAMKEVEHLFEYDFTTKSRDQIIKDLKLDADLIKNLDEVMSLLKKNGVTDGFTLYEILEERAELDAPFPKINWKLKEE